MRSQLDEGIPPKVEWLCAALMLAVVASVGVDSAIPRRGVVVAVLLVATAGWWLCAVRVHLPLWLHASLALAGTGAVNLGAERFGFLNDTADVQISLIVTVFLAGEALARFPAPLAALTVAGAAVVALAPFGWEGERGGPIWLAATAVLAPIVGAFLRMLLNALAELNDAQEELAATAAAAERHRIAREVHDVIAHSLTVSMLHVTAARMAVGRGDPGAATEALEEAERAGRRSLADVRRTVGLLRAPGGDRAPAAGLMPGSPSPPLPAPPTPLAEDVADLVQGYRAAGLHVELAVTGDLSSVDATAGLALYRIVQESLANVARHTPGVAAAVAIHAADPTTVRIVSEGGRSVPGPSRTGAGLVGMRERAEALGGRCTAGPGADGRWTVEAELPGNPVAVP